MKRLLTLSILLVFVMAATALATQTRVNTMGEAENIVKDEANVVLYPSTILYYPKLVGAEVDDEELSNFYGHMLISGEETNPLVMGFYFQTYNDDFPYGTPGWEESMNITKLRWIGGMDMSGTPMALGLMYDQASLKEDNPGDKTEQSFTRFGFMLGASLLEKKLEAAGELKFASWTNKDADGTDITEPTGDIYMAFRARYWMDPMGKWTLVPHVGVGIWGEGYKDIAANTERTWARMDIDLGLGANYNATEDVLMVGDFGFRVAAENLKYEPPSPAVSTEAKSGTLVLPYFRMGLDGKVLKWLDFRGGVISEWVMSTYEPADTYKTTRSYASTTTYLGAGFNWGKFMIDTEFNPELLEDGPYFISGEDNSMNWCVSLIYWLD